MPVQPPLSGHLRERRDPNKISPGSRWVKSCFGFRHQHDNSSPPQNQTDQFNPLLRQRQSHFDTPPAMIVLQSYDARLRLLSTPKLRYTPSGPLYRYTRLRSIKGMGAKRGGQSTSVKHTNPPFLLLFQFKGVRAATGNQSATAHTLSACIIDQHLGNDN